ncbi:hypothetical protein GWO13_07300, partial [Candidatus Bathyarchaeota archaeon]|nr:hypothetical protein [Candidatus Bathyarchaeota archaeon]
MKPLTALVAVLVVFLFIASFSLSQANAEQEIDSKNLSGLEATHSTQLESEKKALPEFKSEDKSQRPLSHAKFSSLQVPFIKNEGQVDDKVYYYANTFAGTIFVTKGGLTYSIPTENLKESADIQFDLEKNSAVSEPVSMAVIREEFVTTKNLQPSPHQKSKTAVNYFAGKEENWITNISTFDSIDLGEVFPNVDVRLKAHGNNVEKIFVIKPGGNPQHIRMSFDGIDSLQVGSSGDLLIRTETGAISMSEPVSYQYVDGQKKDIGVSYMVYGTNDYGFVVEDYNANYPLVIDPLLASTFLGGAGGDTGMALLFDSSDNVFVAGFTGSPDFPTTSDTIQQSQGGNLDGFVSKLSSDLSTILTSTYIGGSARDLVSSIFLDSSGNIYLTGKTRSSDYPTTDNAFDQTHGGDVDGVVSKLSSDLSTLSASTFLGGSGRDSATAVSLDSAGDVVVAGSTGSTDFPTTSGTFDQTHNGKNDGFVSKLSSDLSTLSASTYLGGIGNEVIEKKLFFDSSDNIIVSGWTGSSDYPTTDNAFDRTHGGDFDGFVSKLSSDLSTLSASTYLGGSGREIAVPVSIDSSGNVFVAGRTSSLDFPITADSHDQSLDGAEDAFVSKFSSDLSTLSISTFLGGSGKDRVLSVVVGPSDNVYVAGHTSSSDFPTSSDAFDQSLDGNWDAFVSKFPNDLSTLSASTYIGGSGDFFERPVAISLDSSDNVFVTGQTVSSNFPTTAGA